MRKFHQLKSQKGMNLVELVLVMAIISLMAAISIPMFLNYLPTMRLNGAASNLQLALALTRMKAVARNTDMSLLLVKNAATPYQDYRIQKRSGGAWADETDTDREMAPTDLSNVGITITTTFANNRVTFNSRGSCIADIGGATADGTVTLENKNHKTRTISVTGVTGAIKLN